MFFEDIRFLVRSKKRKSRSRYSAKLTLELLEDRLPPASHNWIGGVGNNLWSVAKNWDDGSVPQPGDTVIFDSKAKTDSIMDRNFGKNINIVKINPRFGQHSLTITSPLTVDSYLILNDANGNLVVAATKMLKISTLFFSAGTTSGQGTIEIVKGLNWSGGVISTHNTFTDPGLWGLISGSVAIHSDPQDKTGAAFGNSGTLFFVVGKIDLKSSSFTNLGAFIVYGRSDITDSTPNRRARFINAGTFTKGASITTIKSRFDNFGALKLLTGSLVLQGPGLHSRSFYVGSTARLIFSLQNQAIDINVLLPGTKFSGSGLVENRGTLDLFNNTSVRIQNFKMSREKAQLIGEGTLSAHYFRWEGGKMVGTGMTAIGPGDHMDIVSLGREKLLDNWTLSIKGEADWVDGGVITTARSATIVVGGPGRFNIQNGEKIIYQGGVQGQVPGAKIVLNTGGLLRKAPGVGKTTIEIPVQNWGGKYDEDPNAQVDFTQGRPLP
jgi:hypothetical protein